MKVKNIRIAREKKTILAMINLYCKKNHNSNGSLCDSCNDLKDYALKRLDYCPFGENKPVCNDCEIHCYKKDKREEIKKVMRFSGPRMLFYHPILAIQHLIDEKLKVHQKTST